MPREDVGHEPGRAGTENSGSSARACLERIPAKGCARGRADLEGVRPDVRAAAVGPTTGDRHLALAAVVLNDHPRRPTGLHSSHPRAATYLRARIFRHLQRDVLHRGVVAGGDPDAGQAGRGNVSVDDRHAAGTISRSAGRCRRAQQLVEAETFRPRPPHGTGTSPRTRWNQSVRSSTRTRRAAAPAGGRATPTSHPDCKRRAMTRWRIIRPARRCRIRSEPSCCEHGRPTSRVRDRVVPVSIPSSRDMRYGKPADPRSKRGSPQWSC